MKNYISATFFLTLLTVGALLGLYFLPSMILDGEQLRKVDLLADIVRMWRKWRILIPLFFLLP